MWAAISARGIIGPVFIEESGAAVTFNKERYVEVLKTFKSEIQTLYPSLMIKFSHLKLVPRLAERELLRPSDQSDFEWAPHSPDLSLRFFLCGYLKDRVYAGNPRTITELKEAIRVEMRANTYSVC